MQHALAALGRRDDRARAVRRRHRERRRARLEVLARRVAEVEPVDPDAETLTAEGDVAAVRGALVASSTSAAHQTRS